MLDVVMPQVGLGSSHNRHSDLKLATDGLRQPAVQRPKKSSRRRLLSMAWHNT